MAKLMAVLMLVGTQVEIEGELVKLECAKVYDLEPKLGKALVKQKEADDNPIAIAYHRGDVELYEKLLSERDAETTKSKRPVPATSTTAIPGAGTGAGDGAQTSSQPQQLTEAQQKAQADAKALEDQAVQEQDLVKAQALRDEAQALLKAAGLVTE